MLREIYSPANQNLLKIPSRPGLKDLTQFVSFSDRSIHKNFSALDAGTQAKIDFFVMYDQEPASKEACVIYRQRLFDSIEPQSQSIIDSLPWTTIATLHYKTLKWPIWCSSEFKGAEIDMVDEAGFILCNYFYHAFIASDWYKFWRYHPLLQPQDKSDASYRFLIYCRDTTGSRQYRSQVMSNLMQLKSQIKYDWDNFSQISPEYSAKIIPEDAIDSGIHLVLETQFDSDSLYITEKVFKPMVMSQPFILWANPGTLGFLRNYGFKTFGDIWSEDYDLEPDHDRRMSMLLELVKKIASMSKEDYNELYKKCLPIIEHNRKHFFDSRFQDTCWQELVDSFDKALSRRKLLEETNPGGQLCYYLAQNPIMLEIPLVKTAIKNRLRTLEPDYQRRILVRYPCFVDL